MFNCIIPSVMTLSAFVKCILAAIILGIANTAVFSVRSRHSSSFALTLTVLPPVVAMVIMMVNGNIGAGLGVAGAFSIVRFRSAQGTAKEIVGIFISTAIGLTCGMGYVGICVVFFLMVALIVLLFELLGIGTPRAASRVLKINIPENLDYEGLFDDLFKKYTRSHELIKVKTTNMGTLYELTYEIELKNAGISKEFMDEIRCRNGNLNIICGRRSEDEIL